MPASSRETMRRIADYSARAPAAARMEAHVMVKTLRTALHMTQAQLAKRAGMPQSSPSSIRIPAVTAMPNRSAAFTSGWRTRSTRMRRDHSAHP